MMVYEEWTNVPITFLSVLARDLSEEALMVEAEVKRYLSKIDQEAGNNVWIFERTSQTSRVGKKQAVEPPKEAVPQEKVSLTSEVLVNPAYPDQLVMVGKNLSPEGSAQLKALRKKNQDIFA
ncbi:hypothetical protein Tco_0475502 [Tanacetum coccineum]